MDTVNVLDHGSVELVEVWGSDERIIESARMSTGKGFLGWGPKHTDECQRRIGPCLGCPPGDEKLLKFLWDNKHSTPFEMAGATFEIQAPIFVFREWHRHRTQAYNELSARYTPLPAVDYLPSVERLLINSKTNKQAGTIKDAKELTEETAEMFRLHLRERYTQAEELYQWALRQGVPKELARVHLPVGRYSRMRASANLRNWLAFLTLRMAPAAQWEIQEYARAVHRLLGERFPRVSKLFDGIA